VHDAAHGLRSGALEVVALRRERWTRKRHLRRERDRRRRSPRRGPPLDLAVGGIQKIGRGDPLRPERKHIFAVVGNVPAADHQPAGCAFDSVERGRPIGTDRRARQRTVTGRDQPIADVDAGRIPAIRCVGDVARRRPRRHELVRCRHRGTREFARRERQRPDIVIAVTAIRRERDPIARGRPRRLAIIEGAPRHRLQIRAVRVHRPDLPGGRDIRLKRKMPPVGRPCRLARVHVIRRDARRVPAGGRQRPDCAKQIDRKRPAVWRQRRRDVRPLVQRDVDG